MLCFVVEIKGLDYLNFRGWSIVETNVANDDLTNFTPFQEKFTELASTKHASETMKSVDTLFYLCKKGHLLLLRTLVQDLEYKNPQDDKNYTLLHCAVEFGHSSMVEYLLLSVKDKNPKDSDSMTPLKLATQKEDLPTIELFAPHVNSVDCLDTLFFLCKKGHLDTLKSLLQDSDDRNLQDDDKYSIMDCAAEHNQFKILEYLVQLWHKKNPTQFIIELFAPHVKGSGFVDTLFYLCEKGSIVWLKLLLEIVEDKNSGDKDKYTILHFAAEHGLLNIIESLVPLLDVKNPKAGRRKYANGSTEDQVTPLHLAAWGGNLPVIEFLVPHLNGDINPARANGWTVLHDAACLGQGEDNFVILGV